MALSRARWEIRVPVAEPAQSQYGLLEAAQRAAVPAGAPSQTLAAEQGGQVQGYLTRKVEGGSIGNHVELLGWPGLSQDQSYQGLHAFLTPARRRPPGPGTPLVTLCSCLLLRRAHWEEGQVEACGDATAGAAQDPDRDVGAHCRRAGTLEPAG